MPPKKGKNINPLRNPAEAMNTQDQAKGTISLQFVDDTNVDLYRKKIEKFIDRLTGRRSLDEITKAVGKSRDMMRGDRREHISPRLVKEIVRHVTNPNYKHPTDPKIEKAVSSLIKNFERIEANQQQGSQVSESESLSEADETPETLHDLKKVLASDKRTPLDKSGVAVEFWKRNSLVTLGEATKRQDAIEVLKELRETHRTHEGNFDLQCSRQKLRKSDLDTPLVHLGNGNYQKLSEPTAEKAKKLFRFPSKHMITGVNQYERYLTRFGGLTKSTDEEFEKWFARDRSRNNVNNLEKRRGIWEFFAFGERIDYVTVKHIDSTNKGKSRTIEVPSQDADADVEMGGVQSAVPGNLDIEEDIANSADRGRWRLADFRGELAFSNNDIGAVLRYDTHVADPLGLPKDIALTGREFHDNEGQLLYISLADENGDPLLKNEEQVCIHRHELDGILRRLRGDSDQSAAPKKKLKTASLPEPEPEPKTLHELKNVIASDKKTSVDTDKLVLEFWKRNSFVTVGVASTKKREKTMLTELRAAFPYHKGDFKLQCYRPNPRKNDREIPRLLLSDGNYKELPEQIGSKAKQLFAFPTTHMMSGANQFEAHLRASGGFKKATKESYGELFALDKSQNEKNRSEKRKGLMSFYAFGESIDYVTIEQIEPKSKGKGEAIDVASRHADADVEMGDVGSQHSSSLSRKRKAAGDEISDTGTLRRRFTHELGFGDSASVVLERDTFKEDIQHLVKDKYLMRERGAVQKVLFDPAYNSQTHQVLGDYIETNNIESLVAFYEALPDVETLPDANATRENSEFPKLRHEIGEHRDLAIEAREVVSLQNKKYLKQEIAVDFVNAVHTNPKISQHIQPAINFIHDLDKYDDAEHEQVRDHRNTLNIAWKSAQAKIQTSEQVTSRDENQEDYSHYEKDRITQDIIGLHQGKTMAETNLGIYIKVDSESENIENAVTGIIKKNEKRGNEVLKTFAGFVESTSKIFEALPSERALNIVTRLHALHQRIDESTSSFEIAEADRSSSLPGTSIQAPASIASPATSRRHDTARTEQGSLRALDQSPHRTSTERQSTASEEGSVGRRPPRDTLRKASSGQSGHQR